MTEDTEEKYFRVTCKECGTVSNYPFGAGLKFKDLKCHNCNANAFFGDVNKAMRQMIKVAKD